MRLLGPRTAPRLLRHRSPCLSNPGSVRSCLLLHAPALAHRPAPLPPLAGTLPSCPRWPPARQPLQPVPCLSTGRHAAHLHTTPASTSSHPSWHTEPQRPSWHTSTRPKPWSVLLLLAPSISRTAPSSEPATRSASASYTAEQLAPTSVSVDRRSRGDTRTSCAHALSASCNALDAAPVHMTVRHGTRRGALGTRVEYELAHGV